MSWKLPPPAHQQKPVTLENSRTLKIALAGGHTVLVTYDEGHARALLKMWLEGGFATGEKMGDAGAAYPWAVDPAQIVSIQMFNTKDLQQQPAGPYQGPYGSGLGRN